MNKGLIFGVVLMALMLSLSIAFVSAERGENRSGEDIEDDEDDSDDSNSSIDDSEDDVEDDSDLNETEIEDDEGVEVDDESEDDEVEVEREGNRTKLKIKNSTTHSELEIESEIDDETNKSKIKVKLSNGRNAEIKIMPYRASLRALERLGLKVCNESNNCTIQLKEVGKGNETRASYEIQVERHFKVLGLFKTKAQVRAEIDAENGEVKEHKPWWAFLASEPAE
jgi:hypothetical protein